MQRGLFAQADKQVPERRKKIKKGWRGGLISIPGRDSAPGWGKVDEIFMKQRWNAARGEAGDGRTCQAATGD